jgi:hypothetical protein
LEPQRERRAFWRLGSWHGVFVPMGGKEGIHTGGMSFQIFTYENMMFTV